MMKNINHILLLICLILTASCVNHDEEKSQFNENVNHVRKSSDSNITSTPPLISSLVCQNALDSITDYNLNQLLFDLKKSIQNKDTALLFSTMDSSIVTSHGGAMVGFDDFKYNWKNRNVWAKLEKIIRMGGNYSNDSTFRFPYFTIYQNCQESHKWIKGNEYTDPYITYYTISDTTTLYSDTSNTSKIKAKLVGAFLNRPPDTYDKPFDSEMLELMTLDKKHRGFVASQDLYRTGDYNLIMELDSNHVWRITSFAPCD